MRTALIIFAVLATASTSAASYLVVTSKNIENGTIQPIDLSAKTKRALRGSVGPRGPRGLQGPQGPSGPKGDRAFLGISRTTGPWVSLSPGSTGTSTAACPTGRAIGGGFTQGASGSNLVAFESSALNEVEWRVRMKNIGTTWTETFAAIVVCAY